MKIGKILRFGCFGVIVFFSLIISFFMRLEKIEDAHAETIRNFPVLEGKLYTEKPIEAPLSGQMAAAVFIHSTGRHESTFSTTTSDDGLNSHDFFFVSDGLEIEIDNKRYKLVGNTMDAYANGGQKTEKASGNRLIDKRYVGENDILDANLRDAGYKTKEGPIDVDSSYKSHSLSEFVFINGSPIQIKGRIEGNQVIVLTWEDAS